MPVRLTCFQCDFVLERTSGSELPPRCPSCGSLIACPYCGETLHRSKSDTGQVQCTRCNVDLTGEETKPLGSSTTVPSMPVLPGFEILQKLGQGGMGVVYRARQQSPDREVALKMLPPALAGDPAMLQRFRNEAAVAARLVDSHLLAVFQVIESNGVPVILMPFIDGSDLGRILAQRRQLRAGEKVRNPHPLAVLEDRKYFEAILPLLDRVVDATAALQAAGVLHRDIKPSNILVDGKNNCWLSDFGLARFQDADGGTRLGMPMGTREYASPEQARGTEVDGRTDVFGLGATLYRALTLELPYGRSGAAENERTPPPVGKLQRALPQPRDFDAVLQKALARDPGRRYRNAQEFREDWRRVRAGRLPLATAPGLVQRGGRWLGRHAWQVAAAAALSLAVLFGVLAARLRQPPEPVTPGEPTRIVELDTNPQGAQIAFVPIDPNTGRFMPQRAIRPSARTPLTAVNVPAGEYLVVANLPGRGFQEVYRMVPELGSTRSPEVHRSWRELGNGRVGLWPIAIPDATVTKGMAYFTGGSFLMGPDGPADPAHQETVAPFYLDTTEVALGACFKERSVWPEQIRDDPAITDRHAACFVSFDQAAAYAEKFGKRLPDEIEYEFAATMGGKRTYPWGEDGRKIAGWSFGPVGEPSFDQTPTTLPVYGLFSNVAEWTASRYDPNFGRASRPVTGDALNRLLFTRVVRGGSWSVVDGKPEKRRGPPWEWLPRHRQGEYREKVHRGLGFRCARSAQPRFLNPP